RRATLPQPAALRGSGGRSSASRLSGRGRSVPGRPRAPASREVLGLRAGPEPGGPDRGDADREAADLGAADLEAPVLGAPVRGAPVLAAPVRAGADLGPSVRAPALRGRPV